MKRVVDCIKCTKRKGIKIQQWIGHTKTKMFRRLEMRARYRATANFRGAGGYARLWSARGGRLTPAAPRSLHGDVERNSLNIRFSF